MALAAGRDGAAGFRRTGRAAQVRAHVSKPAADAGRDEPPRRGACPGNAPVTQPGSLPGGCWVNHAMIERGKVNPHHRDQVTAVLMYTAR